MKGINLRSLTGELRHVADAFVDQPIQVVIDAESRLKSYTERLNAFPFRFQNGHHALSTDAFCQFSFEELCMLRYSASIMLDKNIGQLFEERPNYEVVQKIISSMWRWGNGKGTWNELVDSWNGIRGFSFDLNSNFTIRLDYTTGYNEFGYSKFSRTFIDGVFAFLVYYKQNHVMTIGFSIIEGRQILIQQVQLKQRTGNRWLYKLHKNRIEFVIDLFVKYFPRFTFFVIDGESLVKKIIAGFEESLLCAQERVEHTRQYAAHYRAEVEVFKTQIDYMKEHTLKRLAEFYKNCGKYDLGDPVVVNNLTYYKLEFHSDRNELG